MSTRDQLADELAEVEGEAQVMGEREWAPRASMTTYTDATPRTEVYDMTIEQAREVLKSWQSHGERTYFAALDLVKAQGMGDGQET